MFKKCIQCDREIDKHYITITGRCIKCQDEINHLSLLLEIYQELLEEEKEEGSKENEVYYYNKLEELKNKINKIKRRM